MPIKLRIVTAFLDLMPLWPVMVAVLGGLLSIRVSRGRWIIHSLTFLGMLMVPFAYVRIESYVDPTSIDYPGPGEGLIIFPYLFMLLLAAASYAVFCFVSAQSRSERTR